MYDKSEPVRRAMDRAQNLQESAMLGRLVDRSDGPTPGRPVCMRERVEQALNSLYAAHLNLGSIEMKCFHGVAEQGGVTEKSTQSSLEYLVDRLMDSAEQLARRTADIESRF